MAQGPMTGEIPQALNYLSSYLGQQVVDDQRRAVNDTIGNVAKQFNSLGPDATPEQARAVFFDAMGNAAKANTATQVAPLLQNLYNESTNYLKMQKAQAQDDATKSALASQLGIPSTIASGMNTADLQKYVDVGAATTKDYKFTNLEGQTGVESAFLRYKNNGFSWTPDTASKTILDPTTFAMSQAAAVQKNANTLSLYGKEQAIKNYYSQQTVGKPKLTSYTTTVNGNEVPVFQRGTDLYTNQGGKEVPFDPASGNQPLHKYVDPTLGASRDQKIQFNDQKNQTITADKSAQTLAAALKDAGDNSLSTLVTNPNNNAMTGQTGTITKALVGTGTIAASIDKIAKKDPTKGAQVRAYYNDFRAQQDKADDPKGWNEGYNNLIAPFTNKDRSADMWKVQQLANTILKKPHTTDVSQADIDNMSDGNKFLLQQALKRNQTK